jgi:hypothetical protein
MGGGVTGGQVIGRTDKLGSRVEDRPVSLSEFLSPICTILAIDYNKSNETPIGRPQSPN